MKRSSPLFLLILATLLLWQCSKNTSDPPPPDNEPDTTSHNFTWTLDTIGTRSSYLLDVAIVNENDIWAVGEIHTAETDTVDSLGNWIPPYNAVHWNGSEWELMRIFYIFNGQSIFHPLKFIFSFENGEIWFGGNGIVKWDGQQFSNVEIPQSAWGPVAINKAWGSSADNVYIVGDNGHIAHYNGSNWQKLDSGTEADIQDIWGHIQGDDTEVIAIASNAFTERRRALLNINQTSVTLLDTVGLAHYSFTGIWFDQGQDYYLSGSTLYYKQQLSDNAWVRLDQTHPQYYKNAIRGNAGNDVFIAGSFGLLSHYNGSTWRHYTGAEIPVLDGVWNAINTIASIVVAVGFVGNAQGVVLRGRR